MLKVNIDILEKHHDVVEQLHAAACITVHVIEIVIQDLLEILKHL